MRRRIIEAHEAVADVAYRTHDVLTFSPMTPATPMAEHCDRWAAEGRANLWGEVPEVAPLEALGGAGGALHGALRGGALATTFAAADGLLAMLPHLYRIAGELLPCVVHVTARAPTTQAASLQADHSDVMAARGAGCGILVAGSPQEAQDLAAVAQAAALASRIPFLHVVDGFHTSHEVRAIEPLADDELTALLDPATVEAHRARGITPERPGLHGTVQGPDVYFQAREAANPFHDACFEVVSTVLARFAELTGRSWRPYAYHGHPEAERVIVVMGSAAETVHGTVDRLVERGERVGLLRLRLYRPFAVADFAAALPETVRAVAALDRTKEPGAVGEPLFLDVAAALAATGVRVIGGRYGLGGKAFSPAMVKAVFDELERETPRSGFTVGIVDDVTGRSLPVDAGFDPEPEAGLRAILWGFAADGTAEAAKHSLEILAGATGQDVQGKMVYDARKAGARVVAHLRARPGTIRAGHLLGQASFVACHHPGFLERFDVLEHAEPGAVVLLNTPEAPTEVWARLPREAQEEILAKGLRLWVIDAAAVARQARLPGELETVLQAAFFALAGVLPQEAAIRALKDAQATAHAGRGPVVVKLKHAVIDAALEHLRPVAVPAMATSTRHRLPIVQDDASTSSWSHQVRAAMMHAGRGDALPVSALPVDGGWPLGRGQPDFAHHHGLARDLPIWRPDVCIQCNQCVAVCPHAALRAKLVPPGALAGAPPGFRSAASSTPGLEALHYVLQVVPDDCTGCGLCVEVCPAGDRRHPHRKALVPIPTVDIADTERAYLEAFLALPETATEQLGHLDAETSQLVTPLFTASGACAGCGETPYLKLLTQLFGERLVIANATGCSSSYAASLPGTPYTANADGRGPSWSRTLSETTAEYGLGLRLALDARRRRQPGLAAPSLWIVGGDGWAYDTGAGGLDHVLAQGRDVNVLVLDNEVHANTGGQATKATPLGAAAKLAGRGKETVKKELGLEVMSYGDVYVAHVALGASMNQTVEALLEADAYPGPALVIAYSHCVFHGYDLAMGVYQQRRAVGAGLWPLYRYDPRRAENGEAALHLDAAPPSERVADFVRGEARFRRVEELDPERFRRLMAETKRTADARWEIYRKLATAPAAEPART